MPPPGGLVVRLVAYVLLVPVFLGLRGGYYLLHPGHRETAFNGACPQSEVLSLDWFSVGILATGLPLALQDLGPWVGMNAVFLLGLFIVPRFVTASHWRVGTKFAAILTGTTLFMYAKYGDMIVRILLLPQPAGVLGPIATFQLADSTTEVLLAVTNSFATGLIVIAGFAATMNYVLTRRELTDLPLVHHTLPRRDPLHLVMTSAALGTLFYLSVIAVATGHVSVIPN